jgi:hypothetical protein
MYLAVKAPKVLILAGTDRLDKPLTIGQMQGKFQLVLLPQVGQQVPVTVLIYNACACACASREVGGITMFSSQCKMLNQGHEPA